MDTAQLISNYFESTLTDEGKVNFEQYLESDIDFANELAFQENVKKAISLNERKDLKIILQSFEKKKQVKKLSRIWFVAASVAFLAMGSFWFFNQPADTDKLYSQYYQTYPNNVLPTVRGESKADIKSQAFYEYDNGNYKKANVIFSKLYETSNDDYALFYSGMSLIELQKYDEAIALLNKFDLNKQNEFSPFIKWYKALCYLKLDQKKEAKLLLKSIAIYQNSQKEMAEKLLKDLE